MDYLPPTQFYEVPYVSNISQGQEIDVKLSKDGKSLVNVENGNVYINSGNEKKVVKGLESLFNSFGKNVSNEKFAETSMEKQTNPNRIVSYSNGVSSQPVFTNEMFSSKQDALSFMGRVSQDCYERGASGDIKTRQLGQVINAYKTMLSNPQYQLSNVVDYINKFIEKEPERIGDVSRMYNEHKGQQNTIQEQNNSVQKQSSNMQNFIQMSVEKKSSTPLELQNQYVSTVEGFAFKNIQEQNKIRNEFASTLKNMVEKDHTVRFDAAHKNIIPNMRNIDMGRIADGRGLDNKFGR